MSLTKVLGAVSLVLGIALFSTIEIGQKYLVRACGTTIDSNVMVFVRFSVTGLVLLIMGYPGFHRLGLHLHWKDWGIFALNGLLGFTLSISLFHYAIDQFQNASSAAVVFSANSVFVLIFARFINRESWSLGKWLAVIVGLIGICLFMFDSGRPTAGTFRALLIMSVAAMLFALSVCFTKRVIGRYGAMIYMGGSSLLGGLFALPMFFLTSDISLAEAILPMRHALWGMAYYVLVATALAYWLFYIGLVKLSAFAASMSFMLKPVLACLLSQLVVYMNWLPGESRMNVATITGTILILLAMGLSQISNLSSIRKHHLKASTHA